ncbi:hypothetical protein GCM10023161_45050 [Mycobacterium paraffinicum]|uniref:Uncharacterized protein n=1 Tax=Mycobacterium paraffinicum TaxID=53378 RepID=A0ABP8F4G7_9MYCO
MVIGQDDPVPPFGGADQSHPKSRRLGEVADRGAFGGTHLLDLFLGVQFEELKRRRGVGRNDLDRRVEFVAEPGGQVGMAVDDPVYGIVQAMRVQGAGDGDVQLHRVQVAGAAGGAGVKVQSVLQGSQRQDVGDPVPLLQLVDLGLAEPGGDDIGGCEPAAAALDMRADAGQGVEPQPAEPADLAVVECGTGPRPGRVQAWAGAGVIVFQRDGVDFHGVSQGHRHGGRGGDRQPVLADAPQLVGEVGGARAHPAQIVEPDRRIRTGHVDVGVEVTQQPEGQAVGQRAELFFGGFDHRTQGRVTAHDLSPAQPPGRQGDRVFGGEPAHRARQVDVGEQVVVATVAFNVDADGCATVGADVFGPGHAEGDQQDVGDAGVKRRGHLAQQQAGRLGIQCCRQVPGARIGIHLGLYRRQHGRERQHLSPAVGLVDDCGGVGVLIEQCGPAGKRGPGRRQRDRLSAAMLTPRDVQVLQQDSPGHRVDGKVVNDQRQLAGGGRP